MQLLLIIGVLASFAYGSEADVQSVKTAKAPSRFIYIGGENRRFPMVKDAEPVGVCYIEVPTAQLFNNKTNIPAGNGSRPDLSRIRTCCHGYTRNIHDYTVCDPVCSKGCINSLCVAPEICQCYPDYVKNAVGECTATCPIGCKNGQCSGGECICDSGYNLDPEGKYCMPFCNNNCGGYGKCTAPNTCACQPGYASAEGSCKPFCDSCENGQCIAPNTCQCYDGYAKDASGKCKPQCSPSCPHNANCLGPDVCSPSISNSPKYSSESPLNVVPLQPENQFDNVQNRQGYQNQYINNNYPDQELYNPHGIYQGNIQQTHQTDDNERQIQQRNDSFYLHQRNAPYPYPNVLNMQQGNLPHNSLNSTQQRPGQETIQHHKYHEDPYPSAGPNTMHSSHPRRGDIESVNDRNDTQQSNTHFSSRGQQNVTLNSMNKYAAGSHNSQGTMVQFHQGAYNGSQQQIHDFRSQGTFDSTQYQSHNNVNRSYDSSSTDYSSSSYGNFNHDIQNSSSHGRDSVFQSNPMNHVSYASSQDGAFDSDETQSSTDNRNFDYQQENYRLDQERENSDHEIQTSLNHGTWSSQQEVLHDFNDETQRQSNQGYILYHHGSFTPNLEPNSYHVTNGSQANHNSNNSMQSSSSQGRVSASQQREFDSISDTQSSINERNFNIHQNTMHNQRNENQGSLNGFTREETQNTEKEENDDTQLVSQYPTQLIYLYNNTTNNQKNNTYGLSRQNSYNSSRQGTASYRQNSTHSSSQESYNASMGVTQTSINERNHSHGEYYSPHSHYSPNNSTQSLNIYNQVSNQAVAGNSDDDEPECLRPCINSRCVASYYHNECRCKPGYVPDKLDPYICHPHCPGGCPNGVCTSPHHCQCHEGYTKDTSVKGRSVCRKL